MDSNVLIAQAIATIHELTFGTIFTLKDLFEIDEWEHIAVGKRQTLGRYFRTQVDNGLIPHVFYFDNRYGTNRYIKKEDA